MLGNSRSSSSSQSFVPPSTIDSELTPEEFDGSVFLPEFPGPSRTRSLRIAMRKLPKDFSTLIRPSSRARARNPFLEKQSHGPARVVLQADYADDLVAKSFDQQIVVQRPEDMFMPEPRLERASRKRKSESRFYNLLHRSRSRSRSRSRAGTRSPSPPIPEEPLPHHNRDSTASGAERPTSSVMSSPSSTRTARAGSKPTTRIPSRPLSSTTTATTTTITPRTPTKTRIPKSKAIVPSNTLQENARPAQGPSSSRPSSPKPSGARKKLHSLFGIPLSGTRKLSFGSRSSSPGPSGHNHDPEAEVPPLPSHRLKGEHSESLEFKQSQSTTSSHSQSKSWTTSSNSYSQNKTEEFKPKRSNSGSKLVRLFSGRSSSKSRPHGQEPGESNISVSTSTPIVSAPLLPKSKTHRRSGLGGSLDSTTPRITSDPFFASSKGKAPTNSLSSNRGHDPGLEASTTVTGIPHIMTTPATPIKSGAIPTRIAVARLETIDSEGGPSWRPMAMVDEEGRMGIHEEDNKTRLAGRRKLRNSGKERDERRPNSSGNHGQTQTNASTRGLTQAKSHLTSRGTKHGSFDFERPGWSSGLASGKTSMMARSVSGGSTSGGSALTSRTGGSGINQSKESVNGSGVVGIGTATRSTSTRKGTKEVPISIPRPHDQETVNDRRTIPLEPDHTGSSTHTSASGGTGLTSSFGRSSGRKVAGGPTKLFSGGIVGHGPFPFEPPVPSPTMTASTNPSPSSTGDFAKQQQQRLRTGEIEGGLSAELHEEVGSRHRTGFGFGGGKERVVVPIPVPPLNTGSKPNAGYRPGTKGRSLDLGLGLAWAPSKVREEALLPFGRSLSVSRRGDIERGHREGREIEKVDSRLAKAGREIAEIFRSVLDEEAYATFKRYVHRFDAQDIPFDGPSGIVARVERLLAGTPNLDQAGKKRLLDSFVRIILQNT